VFAEVLVVLELPSPFWEKKGKMVGADNYRCTAFSLPWFLVSQAWEVFHLLRAVFFLNVSVHMN